MNKNNTGITLVALVSTIIITLIIAGVAISLVVGEDGIFSKANHSSQVYTNAARDEKDIMDGLLGKMNEIMGDPLENADYIIRTVDELKAFALEVKNGNSFENKIVMLGNDIDLGAREISENNWSGESFEPIGIDINNCFKGTFDGLNHKIKGLYINAQNTNAGLFANNKGTIKNLGVVDSYIYSNNTIKNIGGTEDTTTDTFIVAGAIVGKNIDTGQVINCYSTSTVKMNSGTNTCSAVGGVVGLNINGAIIDGCDNLGKVEGTSTSKYFMQAGVSGLNENAIVKNCSNNGEIKQINVVASGHDATGGVVGKQLKNALVENCTNSGTILHNNTSALSQVGGVIGLNTQNSIAKNCTNKGIIDGNTYATNMIRLGGVIGGNFTESTAEGIKNTGEIKGNVGSKNAAYIGGTIGYNWDRSTANNCTHEGLINCVATSAATVRIGGVLGTHSTSSTANTLLNKGTVAGSATATGYAYIGGNIGYTYLENSVTNAINEGNVITEVTAQGIGSGGIAGLNYEKTTFTNVHNLGDIDITANIAENFYCAGIIGINEGTLTNAHNQGNITSTTGAKVPKYCRTGGLTGTTRYKGILSNSYNIGNISIDLNATGNISAGGVTGIAFSSGLVTSCYNKGNITYNAKGKHLYIGGVSGYSDAGKFQYCYNTGSISGTNTNTADTGIAGILGGSYTSVSGVTPSITNCYNRGNIDYSNSVGFVGYIYNGTATKLFYLTGTAKSDTISGTATSSSVKTRDELQDAGFITTLGDQYFKMDEETATTKLINDGYPILIWEDNSK